MFICEIICLPFDELVHGVSITTFAIIGSRIPSKIIVVEIRYKEYNMVFYAKLFYKKLFFLGELGFNDDLIAITGALPKISSYLS